MGDNVNNATKRITATMVSHATIHKVFVAAV
jgi:hypothetical protein